MGFLLVALVAACATPTPPRSDARPATTAIATSTTAAATAAAAPNPNPNPKTSTTNASNPASQPIAYSGPGQCRLVNEAYPDPVCNPGAISPRVTQANIHETVCSRNRFPDPSRPNLTVSWNARERALYLPRSDSDARRRQMASAYNLAPTANFELDHIVPISLGGGPQAVANTFPQPWDGAHGANAKDKVEVDTWRKLCSGQLSLAQAQAVFLGGRW